MIKFEHQLEIMQLLVPSLSVGVLFIGIVLFSYIYKIAKKKVYLSILIMAVFSLFFVLGELGVLFFGGWLIDQNTGRQFHRIEQVSGVFFIFAVPYFLYHITDLKRGWKNFNKNLALSGLIISVFIAVCAFIIPDTFISLVAQKESYLKSAADYGRGKEGPLYQLRDIILGLLMIYSLFCLIYEIKVNKSYKYKIYVFIGLVIAIIGAVQDILFVYNDVYFGLFPDSNFSRFALGITLFVSFTMAGLIKQFLDQSLEAEISCRNMNNAYKALESSEGKFRQLAENINEVFIIFDFINKAVLYVSPAFEAIWDKPSSILFDDPYSWMESVHPDDKVHVESLSKVAPKDGKIDYEYRIISREGNIKWISDHIFSIRNEKGEVYRLARIIKDITDRKKSEDELTYMAYHDVITDIPNRRAFFEKFEDLIKQANRNKTSVNIAVFYMNLDRFKYINESMGHEIGDQVLRKISSRIKLSLRDSDYLYRIGGDEFSVILHNISLDIDSGKVAQKLLEAVSRPMKIEEREMFLGISIGISVYPKDGNDAFVLIKNSDIALQNAKQERNTYKFYNEEMNRKSSDKIEIEKNLHYALEKEQFTLYYQPFVSFNGNIIGMEALIRWNHPELGFIPPDKFIPIAESTGQIMKIGDWTLQVACRQIKEWHKAGFESLRVAVNLSARQFLDEDLVAKIEEIIRKTNISPSSLELEITESSVMENPDEAINKINQLYDKGITFSIDDFGTGYSSLSYLKKFKVNHLKVDRSFIKDIITDQSNTQITKAIIDMAHNLKMKVIAEGVETVEQKEFLTSIKCDIMQGYLFSRPVPAADFLKLLKIGDFK